jgi:hypothetical protein
LTTDARPGAFCSTHHQPSSEYPTTGFGFDLNGPKYGKVAKKSTVPGGDPELEGGG